MFTTHTFDTFDIHMIWANASNRVFVCRKKNKDRRSDRNRGNPASSQIILYSRVGRSEMYQSPMVLFFPLGDVSNKIKPRLFKKREVYSLP